MSGGPWGIDAYDVANQGLTSHHVEAVDGRLERFSVPFRYVWPAELDLMAEVAGMRLHERWTGWKREPFTTESDQQVSEWEKPRVSPSRYRRAGGGTWGQNRACTCRRARGTADRRRHDPRSVVIVDREWVGRRRSRHWIRLERQGCSS